MWGNRLCKGFIVGFSFFLGIFSIVCSFFLFVKWFDNLCNYMRF